MHSMQERAIYHLTLQANISWGCLRYERQWDPRRYLWKLHPMLELHTELTLVSSPLAALHPSSRASLTPRAEPRTQEL